MVASADGSNIALSLAGSKLGALARRGWCDWSSGTGSFFGLRAF